MHKPSKFFIFTLLSILAGGQQAIVAENWQERWDDYNQGYYQNTNYQPEYRSNQPYGYDYRGTYSDRRPVRYYDDRRASDNYYYYNQPRYMNDSYYSDYDRGYHRERDDYYRPSRSPMFNDYPSDNIDHRGQGRYDMSYRNYGENSLEANAYENRRESRRGQKWDRDDNHDDDRDDDQDDDRDNDDALAETTVKKEQKHKEQNQSHKDFFHVINNQPSLSTLAQLLKAAGADQIITNQEQITIFAPNNKAFQKNSEQVQLLLKPENKQKLLEFLRNYMVAGRITSEDFKTSKLHTVGGKDLDVNVSGSKVTINKANVVEPDLKASNGTIHVIDALIVPQ